MRDEGWKCNRSCRAVSYSALSPHPSSLTLMRYGLIAGNGQFPFLVLEEARRAGVSLAVAAICEETDPEIEQMAGKLTWVGIGQFGEMIPFFKREGVERAIIAGR